MKISLVRLSTKDLATLAQRIISRKYPVISNHPLTATLQTPITNMIWSIPNKS